MKYCLIFLVTALLACALVHIALAAGAADSVSVTVPGAVKCYQLDASDKKLKPFIFELVPNATLASDGTLIACVKRQHACLTADTGCCQEAFGKAATAIDALSRISAFQDTCNRVAVINLGCCTQELCSIPPSVKKQLPVEPEVLAEDAAAVVQPTSTRKPSNSTTASMEDPEAFNQPGSMVASGSGSNNTATAADDEDLLHNTGNDSNHGDALVLTQSDLSSVKPVSAPSSDTGASKVSVRTQTDESIPSSLQEGTVLAQQGDKNSAQSALCSMLVLLLPLLAVLGCGVMM